MQDPRLYVVYWGLAEAHRTRLVLRAPLGAYSIHVYRQVYVFMYIYICSLVFMYMCICSF